MLTVTQCRKILGERFKNCTDQQIEMIRDFLYKLVKLNRDNLIRKDEKLE